MCTFREFFRKGALFPGNRKSREPHIQPGPAAVITLELELWTTALMQRQAMQTSAYAR
jgi:hypothetical protein